MSHETVFVLALLVAHYFGDWYFQSREMAMNKSKNLKVLLNHLLIVTLFLSAAFLFSNLSVLLILTLLILNAIIHGIIDWNMWGGYKRCIRKEIEKETLYNIAIEKRLAEYPYWNDKRFYDRIGFDQLLHIATLAILFL